jgi:threonine dehydrogenase-like Zn-dependent dehydrogenase
MKAIYFLGNRQAELREVPNPQPGPGQVVVAMKAAAICGSDLHFYRLPADGPFPYQRGVIAGHEPCGVVESVGPCVSKVKPGDRVVVYHYVACGHCEYCASGDLYYCKERKGYGWHIDGSMADHILTDEQNCLPLPPKLSYVDGMFISCIGGTAYAALKRIHVSALDTLFVNGLGPLGLVMVLFGKAAGARVIGADIVKERIDLALDIGIDTAFDASQENVPEVVIEFTHGRGASTAFDTTGIPAANENCLRSMEHYGRVVIAGMSYSESKEGINLNLEEVFLEKQLTLTSVNIFPRYMYWEITRFLIEHKIPLESIVTHRFPLERGLDALKLADTGRAGKVAFVW